MSSSWVEMSYLWACTAWDETSNNMPPALEFMRRSDCGRWLGVRLCISKAVRKEQLRNMKHLSVVYKGFVGYNMMLLFVNRSFGTQAIAHSDRLGTRLCVR